MEPPLNRIPPPGAVFNPEFLSNLKFATGDQAVTYLKALAVQNGFELSLRDGITDAVIRLYCHRGNRGHGTKTTKTDCPFRLKFRQHGGIYAITENSFLEHNHDPLPFKPEALPKDVEEHAKVMASIGCGRPVVAHFIHQLTGQYPTASQLASFFTPDRPCPDASQSEGLMELMAAQGGLSFEWQTVAAGTTVRGAVFTVTEQERINLEKFGDVLFLDGTAIRNELGWTTYPVGLLDSTNHIISGGLLFTAFERQEVFYWFLHLLIQFLGNTLQTIFTDEDLAMMATMAVIRGESPELRHRLCGWHKEVNFEKRVRAICHDAKVVAAALQLFDLIMYDPSIDAVDHAFEKLQALLPQLARYIETELWDLREQLTEAYRGDAFTLGRRTNQAGESNNNILRRALAPGARTLAEIREAYTQAHTIKAGAAAEVVARRFQRKHFTEAAFDIKFHRYVCHWIDRLVNESKLWVCVGTADPTVFQARYQDRMWQLSYDGTNLPVCECNETSGTGLPCCHLIALFAQKGDGAFPVQVIARRWIPNPEDFTVPQLPELTLHQTDLFLRVLSEASSDDDDEIPEETDPIHAGRDGATAKYNRVMMVAKEIAQRASVNAERYDGVLADLEGLRDSLTFVAHGEIQDAAGVPKGRPRGSGHSRPDRAGPTHCPLCDSDAHNLPDCRYHSIFRKAQKKYVPPPGGKILCPLCSFRGHRAGGCPVVRMAREMLREKNPRRKQRAPAK